jgi:hypothetical protein
VTVPLSFCSIDQYEAKVVLGVPVVANDMDGEAVLSGSGKYVNAAAFQ